MYVVETKDGRGSTKNVKRHIRTATKTHMMFLDKQHETNHDHHWLALLKVKHIVAVRRTDMDETKQAIIQVEALNPDRHHTDGNQRTTTGS